MGKIAKKKEEKRSALLNAAFELFTVKGLHQTSISDISKKAGVAKGTFYLYFKDKYSLQTLLISRKADGVFMSAYDALDVEEIQDFAEQILFIVHHILVQLNNNKTMVRFLSKHLSWGIIKDALIAEGEHSDHTAYIKFEELLIASGIAFERPDIMIYLIIELVSSVSYNAILYQQPASIDQLMPYLDTTIKNIIKAHTQ